MLVLEQLWFSCNYTSSLCFSQSVFIGFISAIFSNISIGSIRKTNIDDTLDVFPSHGIGGIMGMILTAVFAK